MTNYTNRTPPVVSGNRIWFAGALAPYESNIELWSSDGTPEGTSQYADLDPKRGSSPYLLTDGGDNAFFVTGNGYDGTTLWNTAAAPEIEVQSIYSSPVANGGTISFNSVIPGESHVKLKSRS